jgi:murein DD-endopeptidase MepM/ murein hydrolase activator NlpD
VQTQVFGSRPEYYKKYNLAGHNGVDFRTRFFDSPFGRRPVYTCLDGRVKEIGAKSKIGYGFYIRIIHNDNSETLYAHLSGIKIKINGIVKAGQIIAVSGNTGDSTGPHLHFGFRPANFNYNNGYAGYINPAGLFI